VINIEGGTFRHNPKKHIIEWELSVVDKTNSTANFEFTIPGSNESDFFPVTTSFTSEDMICPVHVSAVHQLESGEPAKFGLYRQLQAEKYEVVAQAD